jgi:cell division protein FtsA
MTDEGRLDVIGIGQTESKGLRKGVVINLEATVESIKRVVEEAELMAGVEIGSAYAPQPRSGFNSRRDRRVGRIRIISGDLAG